MIQKPNWCAIDRPSTRKVDFWNNIQPNQYSTEDLFYLKERTNYIIGGFPPYFAYWIWSVLILLLSWMAYGISQLPINPKTMEHDLYYHDVNLTISMIMLVVGIILIPYSLYIRKKQLRQSKLLNNCKESIITEIEYRDRLAYAQKH